jgi:hypothetical protein
VAGGCSDLPTVHAAEGLASSRYAGRWTPGAPSVRLWLVSDREQVMIQVSDGSHLIPQVEESGLDAESGRGLLLVTYMCSDWVSYAPKRSSGKIVWTVDS